VCFFSPKVSVPTVATPAVAATPINELPTPEPAVLGGSDEENSGLGTGSNKENKTGKSALKIKLADAPVTSTTTGANLGFNTTK